jgi:hypothetical protein
MLLPPKVLNQIEYYKYDLNSNGSKDLYILYYKSFWRLPKKIIFQRVLVPSENNPGSFAYISSSSSLELLNQLSIYFDSSNKLVKITEDELVNLINYILTKTYRSFKSYNHLIEFLESEYNLDVETTVLSSINNENNNIVSFPKKPPPK